MATAATATEGTTASRPHDARLDGRPDHGAAAARTEELYRDHGRLVGGLCRALLRDGAEAEDAAQQVFLAAHRALLNGTTPREPAAWLATIARNECWARIRTRMREPLPTDEVEGAASLSDPLAEAIRNADLAALWSAVAELPRQQRNALLLREFGGLSYEELAGALAVSGPAVESLLFRARHAMRTRLEAAYAGLTGASWIEALSRLAGGIGSGMAPVAAKVAAVGAGAAVVTGGAVVAPTMLEHVRHARPAPARTVRTTKVERPARVAQQLPVFVARATPHAAATPARATRLDDRHGPGSSGRARSGDDGGAVGGDAHSGRDGSGSPGTSIGSDSSGTGSDGSGDARETAESASRSGHGDGSGSDGGDRSSSGDGGDGGGSAATGGGSGSASGGNDSSSGDGSGPDQGSDGGHGSGGGDSGSGDGGVVTTVPNPVVTVTVASGDAPPALGGPPPGDDG